MTIASLAARASAEMRPPSTLPHLGEGPCMHHGPWARLPHAIGHQAPAHFHHIVHGRPNERTDPSANRGHWGGHCGSPPGEIHIPERGMPQGQPVPYDPPKASQPAPQTPLQYLTTVFKGVQKLVSNVLNHLESFTKHNASQATQDKFFNRVAAKLQTLGQAITDHFKPVAPDPKPAAPTASPPPSAAFTGLQKAFGDFITNVQKALTDFTNARKSA